MWQTKYALAVPKNLGVVPKNLEVGVDFWPCSEGDFLTWLPYSLLPYKHLHIIYKPSMLKKNHDIDSPVCIT